MKISELQVQDYGVFSGWGLSFDEERFHVVYGPNEAGKSTLLELLREMLFGFNRKCAYHDIREAPAAASMACILSDGTALEFSREKRKSSSARELTGSLAGGEPLDKQRLAVLLGNADRPLFETVFAFSLKELALGQESLKKANVAERLFSIGAGGLKRFTHTREELRKTLDTLLKPRGRNQALNVAWSAFDLAEKTLRKVEVVPRDFEKRRKELAAAEETHAAAKGAMKEANALRARLENLRRAHEHWRDAQIARAELAELPESADFPLAKADLFRTTTESLAQARRRRREADEELSDVRRELAATEERLDPDLLAAADRIARFQQDLSRMRDIREGIPRLEASTSAQARSAADRVRELCHEWTVDDLESTLRFDEGARADFRRLRDELRESEAGLSAAKEKLARCETELERTRTKREDLDAVTADETLESLVGRAKDYHLDAREVVQTAQAIAQKDRAVSDARSRLAADVGLPSEGPLEGLCVPSTVLVDEWVERFAALTAEVEDAARAEKHREAALVEARDAAARLQSEESVPDRASLTADRTRRDATWNLIRRRFVDAEPVGDEEITAHLEGKTLPIADAYEREVADADALADACFDRADAVSRREQALEAVCKEQAALAELQEARRDAETRLAEAGEQWQTLWETAGFAPQSPAVMRAWLDDFDRLRALAEEKAALSDGLAATSERLEAYQRELDAALDDSSGSIEARLDRAERRVRAAHDAGARRRDYEERIEQLTEERARFEKDAAEAARCRENIESEAAERRDACGLPSSWNLETVTEMLPKIAELVAENDQRRADAQRLASYCETWDEFERQAGDLSARIAPDLAEGDVLAAIETLAARCVEAQKAQTSHDNIARNEKAVMRRLADETARCEEYEGTLGELRAAAGVETDEAFLEKAAEALRRNELAGRIETDERTIREIAYPEPEATFRESLDGLDIDALPGELADAARTVEDAEAEVDRAHAVVLEAKKALAELDTREDAVEKAADVENCRAALLQTLDTWAPLCLADKLMTDAVARFEREKQPRLLQRTAEWFRAMTAGRYVDVKTKIESRGDLFVVDTQGRAKTPEELSTGTREQLYLALRLSFVEHYCRASEPLPLIFDDVLVNFDDQREQETLAALAAEIPQNMQVLFLTCHEETRRRAEAAWAGACRVHALP